MANKNRLGSSIRLAACALGLSFGLGAAAHATPIPVTTTFTWNPSAVTNSPIGPFTANQFALQDFASIVVPPNPTAPGSVTESGVLLPSTFNLITNSGTTPVVTANIKGTFGIYEQFTATSHLSPCVTPGGSGVCGAFDSATASVFVYSTAKGVAHVKFVGTTPTLVLPNSAKPVLVATETGPIGPSPNFVNILGGVPGATVDTSFVPNPAESAFFIKPPATVTLDLDQAFTNTPGVVRTVPGKCKPGSTCIFEIRGGGGNGNFFTLAVPEPSSLALFGFGAAALGFVRRRRT